MKVRELIASLQEAAIENPDAEVKLEVVEWAGLNNVARMVRTDAHGVTVSNKPIPD